MLEYWSENVMNRCGTDKGQVGDMGGAGVEQMWEIGWASVEQMWNMGEQVWDKYRTWVGQGWGRWEMGGADEEQVHHIHLSILSFNSSVPLTLSFITCPSIHSSIILSLNPNSRSLTTHTTTETHCSYGL